MDHQITLRQLREKTDKSKKDKTITDKRSRKIKRLQTTPEWPGLESVNHSTNQLNEDLSRLNKAYMNFRFIYSSGKKYNAKEWIEVMTDLFDEIE